MEWSDLLSFLRVGENASTKFFSQIRHEDELGPVIVGLYNSKGGNVFIGIDLKNYHLLGTSIDRQWIEALIQDSCKPFIQIGLDFISKNGKVVICLHVPEGLKKPAYYKNQCFVLQSKEPYQALAQGITTPLFKLIENPKHQPETLEEIPLSLGVRTTLDAEEDDQSLDILTAELLDLTQSLKEENVERKVEPIKSLNSRQSQVLHYLKENSSVSNKGYRGLYSVSHKTAHIELVDLVAKGYLVQTGAGRNTAYESVL